MPLRSHGKGQSSGIVEGVQQFRGRVDYPVYVQGLHEVFSALMAVK